MSTDLTSDGALQQATPFPVVGVGASAGGLEAFGQLLNALGGNTGMAFVLVQHLDPQHESKLAEILTPSTPMRVVTVFDGVPIEPDRVYVIPPNTTMVMEDAHLRLVSREAGLHLPIDSFFESLAHVQGSRSIGVVLSGNASDGSRGLRAIKAECGLTFAQDEASASFGGMPRNAVATGAVDYVLSPAEIGRELKRLAQHPFLNAALEDEAGAGAFTDRAGELKKIFSLLNAATTVDFSHYKPTTVGRRIRRRMVVLGIDSLADYVRYAESQRSELRELYRDLLISVTSFFRDPDTFAALRTYLAKMLPANSHARDAIRVWVPGCATGEEVYSLAITLAELLSEATLGAPLQIFGTDISQIALDRARQGFYPESITNEVSSERIRRYFHRVDGGYQVGKRIREVCIFARHDVTKDPPFSRVDLLSCRNLLIYLDASAQHRIFPIFHYALKPAGLLLLGSAESAGASSDLFTAVDKQNKIFARKAGPSNLTLDLGRANAGNSSFSPGIPASPRADLQKRLDRILVSKYAPDSVLIDANLQIVQFRGHASPYLDPSPGGASLNLLRMAAEDLVVPLRRMLQAAAESRHSVRETGIPFKHAGVQETLTLEITPVAGDSPDDRYLLIVFLRTEGAPHRQPSADDLSTLLPEQDSRVAQLERELGETRDYLRNMTEEFEAHSEELRAVNEEASSANEELQSTNEELGTTKEELQSANEELTTINEELQHRNSELNATNSDLKNLLASVSAAILMVDSDLRIRRFNAVAEKLMDLGSVDIGRPIGYLRGSIPMPFLEKQAATVIETLQPAEQQIQGNTGHWYSVAARPYRTMDDRIMGAVITVQDIDLLKRGLEAAEEARDYAEGVIQTVREPLTVLDSDLRVQLATPAFYETFLVSREETLGRYLYDLGNGQWNRSRLRELIGAALFSSEPFHDLEIHHQFPHIGLRTMRLNGRRLPSQDGHNRTLLLAIEDVTERREAAEIHFQRLFESAKDGIVVLDAETGIVSDVNPCLLESVGAARDQLVGKALRNTFPFLNVTQIATLLDDLRLAGSIRYDDLPVRHADGRLVSLELVANLYQVGTHPVAQLNLRDITHRKQQHQALRESLDEKALLVREIHHRVKNNLQVIASLLSLQSSQTTDPSAVAAFEESEGRVRAIAQIHETLHATAGLTVIEFSAYLKGLVHDLMKLHATIPDGIALDLQLDEMMLDIEQAIPLGLIANEVIINSLKHGLPEGRGRLHVSLTRLDAASVELRIGDSGAGFPSAIDLSAARSMGFRILYLLGRQLHAKVRFEGSAGANVVVQFAITKGKQVS